MLDAFFEYEFIRNSVYAAVLASFACGIVGSFVVVRKIVFISGGISHTAYGGIGAAYFLGLNPLIGATIFSVVAGFLISWFTKAFKERVDTLIGILWASGMSIGIILINLTPGYAPNLLSYLFGSINSVSATHLYIILVLDGFVILSVIFFYRELVAVSFDEEYAKSLGIKVFLFNTLLLVMIAFTVVVLIQVVGIILVIALLTIPAAIAAMFTLSMKKMMSLAILLSIIFTVGGLWMSYEISDVSGENIPPAATIILFSAVSYVLLACIKSIRTKFLRKKII